MDPKKLRKLIPAEGIFFQGNQLYYLGEPLFNSDPAKVEKVSLDDTDVEACVSIFDKTNPQWRGEGDVYNYFFLRSQENYFNNLLQNRGHVFLNEIYAVLGFPLTRNGALVGWWHDSSSVCPTISFGVDFFSNKSDKKTQEEIVLTFNVQTTVYDKLP